MKLYQAKMFVLLLYLRAAFMSKVYLIKGEVSASVVALHYKKPCFNIIFIIILPHLPLLTSLYSAELAAFSSCGLNVRTKSQVIKL